MKYLITLQIAGLDEIYRRPALEKSDKEIFSRLLREFSKRIEAISLEGTLYFNRVVWRTNKHNLRRSTEHKKRLGTTHVVPNH